MVVLHNMGKYVHPPRDAFPPSKSFLTALSELVEIFEKHETEKTNAIHQLVYRSDSTAVCFYDKYPKAKKHLLLIPRPSSPLANVQSICNLVPSRHLEPLRSFHALARHIAKELDEDASKHSILCGYHAIPSLSPLHLHIISSDFDSDCIKNKKHVNSFTHPEFLVSLSALEERLLSEHPLRIPTKRAQAILDTKPFSCFRCGEQSNNIPSWKRHNRTCSSSVASLPNHYNNHGQQTNSLLYDHDNEIKEDSSDNRSNKKPKTTERDGADIRNFFGSKAKEKEEEQIY